VRAENDPFRLSEGFIERVIQLQDVGDEKHYFPISRFIRDGFYLANGTRGYGRHSELGPALNTFSLTRPPSHPSGLRLFACHFVLGSCNGLEEVSMHEYGYASVS
jgi:hypothetical protein